MTGFHNHIGSSVQEGLSWYILQDVDRGTRLSLLLFSVLLTVVFWTYRDYGISLDEHLQNNYGHLVLRYYSSMFRDRSAIYPDLNLQYYGGFFELLTVIASSVLPVGIYEARHLLSAVFGVLGIFGCWKVVQFVADSGAAFWTALLLSLYPSYYGHMFMNSKDIPFAVLHVWSLYYLLRLLSEFPDFSLKSSAKFGATAGLCMAVRIGGLLLLGYLALWTTVYTVHLLLMRKYVGFPWGVLKRVTVMSCVAAVIAYGVMLSFWPYGLSKPFVNPFKALTVFSSYYQEQPPSPRDYVPRYLLLKLPEIVLLLCAGALWLGFLRLVNIRRRPPFSSLVSYAVIVSSAAFPVVYAIVQKVTLVDEVRHFLFIIPPLFCIAGITLHHILQRAASKEWLRITTLCLLIVYGVYHVWVMVRLHPYEYIYYNALTGGTRGAAAAGYETDYWATSYKEAVMEIEAYLRRRDGTEFARREYAVFISQAPSSATYYFPHNFRQVGSLAEADVYLATTRGVPLNEYSGHEVVVRRFGVPLAVAKILL